MQENDSGIYDCSVVTASKENLITYLALYDGTKPTVWTEQLTQEYYDSVAKKLSAEKK